MSAPAMTHFIAHGAPRVGRGMYRAECGELVHFSAHHVEPTCPNCRARLEADAEATAGVLALHQMSAAESAAHFGGPPVKHVDFDPCAGYRRRR